MIFGLIYLVSTVLHIQLTSNVTTTCNCTVNSVTVCYLDEMYNTCTYNILLGFFFGKTPLIKVYITSNVMEVLPLFQSFC